MSSENSKSILIPTPDGSEMIKVTPEDLQEYTQCVESKRFTNKIISIAGATGTCVAVPIKATTPVMYFVKKGFVFSFAMVLFSVFTEVGSALSCGPILQKIVNSKRSNVTRSTAPREEHDDPSTKELLDFTPNISSQDFSSPINFSSDASDLDRVLDARQDSQELRDKAAGPVKKRVTYDDLWRLHKENSQTRNKEGSEGTDVGRTMENEPIMEKKKIRTNKYGDPLE